MALTLAHLSDVHLGPLPPGAASDLCRTLGALGIEDIEANGEVARFACPRQLKMALLTALTAAGPTIRDIEVHEPSLEDVFLGYSEEVLP